MEDHRYDQWFGDEADFVLFAEATESNERHLRESPIAQPTKLFEDWKRSRAVDLAVVRGHSRRPFAKMVALSECDIVRAAQLRERLGIPGQSLASARSFRDKVIIEEIARQAGLPKPEFRANDTAPSLLNFVIQHGGHIIVKPIDGAGFLGVRELRNLEEVASWEGEMALPSDEPARYYAALNRAPATTGTA